MFKYIVVLFRHSMYPTKFSYTWTIKKNYTMKTNMEAFSQIFKEIKSYIKIKVHL